MGRCERNSNEAWHFCCRYCGDVWACCLPTSTPFTGEHHFLTVPCPSCGVLGSVCWTTEVLKDLPRTVLERELDIACQHPLRYPYAVFSRKEL